MEEREDGGGDVAEAAASPEGGGGLPCPIGDEEEGDGVGGVGGVGAAGDGVDEEFSVAVVGGDEQAAATLADGLVDAAELSVDGLDGADGGLHLAGVTDHVGVGEVDDDDVEGGVADGLDDGVGDAGGGHLGGEVVGGDLLRGDEGAVLAGKGLLDAAVEEVGDVGVLLGLGDAEVAKVGLGHEVGEEVVHGLRGDDDGEFVLLVVLGHTDVVEVFGGLAAGDLGFKFGRIRQVQCVAGGESDGDVGSAGEDAGDLADAVGAVVEVDDDIFVADEADWVAEGVDDGEGRDELVGHVRVVEILYPLDRAGVRAAFRGARDHGVEGLALLLPAEVAVHGEVAAGDAGELADADGLELLLEGFEMAEAAGGHGVAAVEESVDEDAGELVLGGEAEEGVEVAGVGVDAAVG